MKKDKDFVNKFFENGYSVIKDLTEILIPKINKINNQLSEIGKSMDPNFDLSNSLSVKSANKKKFYKAMKSILGLYDLVNIKEFINISKKLKCKIPILGNAYIRSDITLEKDHSFGWHQDGPCLLGSPNSVTFWIPCVDVTKEEGSLEIIEKSHYHGIIKNKPRSGESLLTSNNLVIDEADIPKGKKIILNLKKGEILVFHSLLIHRSYYPEKIKKPRITAIIRYDDVSDKKHREYGFLTSADNKNINSAPEYKKVFQQKNY